MGVIDDIVGDAADSVERFRFWLRLMARHDRVKVSQVIVLRECAPNPNDELVFMAAGERL